MKKVIIFGPLIIFFAATIAVNFNLVAPTIEVLVVASFALACLQIIYGIVAIIRKRVPLWFHQGLWKRPVVMAKYARFAGAISIFGGLFFIKLGVLICNDNQIVISPLFWGPWLIVYIGLVILSEVLCRDKSGQSNTG